MEETKKFELTSDFIINALGKKLFRIKALISFASVKAGEMGGYVEKEENLSQYGNAWVSGDAMVCGNARVSGNAEVFGDAMVCGNARVFGNAEVCGNAEVFGDADYTTIKGFGTAFRCTTFFRCKDGCVRVTCGCFYGTIDEFREQVKKTRSGKIAKEYLMIADLMEMHFEKENVPNESEEQKSMSEM